MRDGDGQPLLSLTFALPLDPNHHLAEKAERLMAENLMLKDNYQHFASLTKREKELLQQLRRARRPRRSATGFVFRKKR